MQNDPLATVTNIQVLGAKTRNRDFLKCVGELLPFGKPKKGGKVDIDTPDYNGYTPLHRASETGNIDMVKYLLSKGSSCNLGDSLGNTPMTLAIKNKNIIIVKLLQMVGGAVYMESVRIGMELCKATQARDYVMLQAWYCAGVEMDQGDYNGRTAMHTAVRNRDVGTVARLLEYGATPLEEDAWGWTAISEAKKHHLTDILMLFHPLFTEKFTTKHLYQLYKSSVEDGLE